MNIRKATLLFSLSLALFVGGLSFAGSQQASAAYNGGRIIDNGVFLNSNSMSAAQIQSFLASKGSGLASRSFVLQCYGANSQERQLYTSVGAACDQNMSAANIIYYASRIYGINPQVIMATLQKEQSLITTGNPTSWQLNQAMGYGCPTTGNCSGNSTFSYQIDSGTWVMRYHYERANGNNNWWSPSTSWVCGTEKNFYKPNLYPGQNVRFYDGNNVLYRTHFIENAATSSFYCYTPHAYNNPRAEFGRPAFGTTGQYYSGSYNFVTAFESWFGSTSGTPLLKGTTPTVFLESDGVRYGVPSSEMLYNYRLLGTRVTPASDSYIGGLADGGVLTTLFTVSGNPTVYLADGGRKIGIPSGEMCVAYGLDCSAGGVREISYDVANSLADGGVLSPLMVFNNTAYKMQAGVRMPYLSAQAISEDGMNPANYTVITSRYNIGFSVGSPIIDNGALVRFPANGTVYYYSAGNFYAIPDGSTYNNWFAGRQVIFDQVSSYAGGPPVTAGIMYSVFRTSGGSTFVLNNGGRIDVSSVASDWPAPLVLPGLDSVAATKPLLATASANSIYRTASSALYRVSSGSHMVFPTMNDFYALGYSLTNLINIEQQTINKLNIGPYLIGEGSVFKVSSDPTSIYLKGPGDSIYYLTSQNQLGQFNLRRIGPVMPASQLNSYTSPKAIGSIVRVVGGSSTYYGVVDANFRLWRLDSAQQTQWGINPSSAAIDITENGPIYNALGITNAPIPAFVVYNGTVYYGNGGVKHPLATGQSYQSLGGQQQNTINITKDLLDAAPTGSVL